MSEKIELRFKYTETEFVSAYRSYMLARKGPTFLILLALVLILPGIYFLMSGGDQALTVSLIATGSFVFGLIATSIGIRPRQRFHSSRRFKSEYLLRFSDEGIEFHTDEIDAKLSWRIYNKARETRDFYLLSDGASTLTVIPKRVFSNAEQESAFKRMLDAKV